jgi:hypothetical protein
MIRVAAVVCLLLATSCSSGSERGSVTLVDEECRNSLRLTVDGIDWYARDGQMAPNIWRTRLPVEGDFQTSTGLFVADDGTRILFEMRDSVDAGCTVWPGE